MVDDIIRFLKCEQTKKWCGKNHTKTHTSRGKGISMKIKIEALLNTQNPQRFNLHFPHQFELAYAPNESRKSPYQ